MKTIVIISLIILIIFSVDIITVQRIKANNEECVEIVDNLLEEIKIHRARSQIFIGDIYEMLYESDGIRSISINFLMADDLINVGDTLFTIVKNDSTYICKNLNRDLYIWRHRSEDYE